MKLSLRKNSTQKAIHDKLCAWVVEQINTWHKEGKLNEKIYPKLWDGMVHQLSKEMGMTPKDVVKGYLAIGITKENFCDKSILNQSLKGDAKAIHQDLLSLFERSRGQSNTKFLIGLGELENAWSSKMDPSALSEVMGVAESSYIFWGDNIDDIEALSDPCRRQMGADILGDDAMGALGGSPGGFAGAVLGGVGCSLISTVANAVGGC